MMPRGLARLKISNMWITELGTLSGVVLGALFLYKTSIQRCCGPVILEAQNLFVNIVVTKTKINNKITSMMRSFFTHCILCIFFQSYLYISYYIKLYLLLHGSWQICLIYCHL